MQLASSSKPANREGWSECPGSVALIITAICRLRSGCSGARWRRRARAVRDTAREDGGRTLFPETAQHRWSEGYWRARAAAQLSRVSARCACQLPTAAAGADTLPLDHDDRAHIIMDSYCGHQPPVETEKYKEANLNTISNLKVCLFRA